jgi:hypothetical protein
MLKDCPLPSFGSLCVPECSALTYMFSNESGIENTFSKLAEIPPSLSNKIHVGFAFWFNLNLIAKRQSAYAIICDIDPGINLLFECLREAILVSHNIDFFTRIYIQKLKEKNFIGCINYVFDEINLTRKLEDEKKNFSSWLSNEKHFLHIKLLFVQQKIICRKFNITDSICFQQFIFWLQQKQSVFEMDTFYTSNIYEWVEKGAVRHRDAFEKNIDLLFQNFQRVTIIDALYEYSLQHNESGPPQRVFLGAKPHYKREKIFKDSFRINSLAGCPLPKRMKF